MKADIIYSYNKTYSIIQICKSKNEYTKWTVKTRKYIYRQYKWSKEQKDNVKIENLEDKSPLSYELFLHTVIKMRWCLSIWLLLHHLTDLTGVLQNTGRNN